MTLYASSPNHSYAHTLYVSHTGIIHCVARFDFVCNLVSKRFCSFIQRPLYTALIVMFTFFSSSHFLIFAPILVCIIIIIITHYLHIFNSKCI